MHRPLLKLRVGRWTWREPDRGPVQELHPRGYKTRPGRGFCGSIFFLPTTTIVLTHSHRVWPLAAYGYLLSYPRARFYTAYSTLLGGGSKASSPLSLPLITEGDTGWMSVRSSPVLFTLPSYIHKALDYSSAPSRSMPVAAMLRFEYELGL